MSPISTTSFANDRGEFWENLVRQLRPNDSSNGYTAYDTKEAFMHMIRTWFEEPDIGMADIAWDLVSMERGEDSL